VTDAAFGEIRPLSDHFQRQIEEPAETHCQLLSKLVPKLRNQFMHGTYLLAPDYVHLAIQMREIADLLRTTSLTPDGKVPPYTLELIIT
jgi:bifunctional pyridoxal-dependent enzyme with beta-cystathionase and maltose regulon repressor activities